MGFKKYIKIKLQKLIYALLNDNLRPTLLISTNNIFVGRQTYHNGNFKVKGKGTLNIGNFCAFGENIKIILSNHDYDYASIQYTLYNKYFKGYPNEKKSGKVYIGSDVWIGDDVIILPNIKIGNGVCIGAGSVITKDVEDYAIVAGVPAKLIKYRFSKEEREKLNKEKWWNWDDKKIIENRDFFFENRSNQ